MILGLRISPATLHGLEHTSLDDDNMMNNNDAGTVSQPWGTFIITQLSVMVSTLVTSRWH